MRPFPALDVHKIVGDHISALDSRALGKKLIHCLQQDGIVSLQNHGISSKAEKALYDEALRFFSLPPEEKRKMERFARCGANGYSPLSAEKSLYHEHLVDYKECYDVRYLDEISEEDIMPAFTLQMKTFARQCRTLAERLLSAMDLAMNTGGALIAMHRDMLTKNGCTELRTLYYPPVPAGVGENTVRCAAHSDYGTLTFLFQDQAGGLQRKTRSGAYETIDPADGELVVIGGDMLEIFSAGQIRALKHRVVIPTTAKQRSSHRQSIAFFVQPDKNAIVTPLSPNSAYKSVKSGDIFRDKFDVIYPDSHRQWYKSQIAHQTY